MGSPASAILTYHSLDASGSVLSTHPLLFRRQMAWLASSGLPVVPLAAASQTPGAVALTFDDGFANFGAEGLPVLLEHRLPATLFVVSGYCGRTNSWPGQPASIPRLPLLDWPAIRDVAASGISVGAHTVNHPMLTSLSGPAVERELESSQSAIEDRIGSRVDAFAYPYGASRPWVRDLVKDRFRLACGTRLRYVEGSDAYDLPRIDAYYLQRLHWFERLMQPTGHAYVGVRRLLRELRACLSRSS